MSLANSTTEKSARAPVRDHGSAQHHCDINFDGVNSTVCEESCGEGGDDDMEVVTDDDSGDHRLLKRADKACSEEEDSGEHSIGGVSMKEFGERLERLDRILLEKCKSDEDRKKTGTG